MNFRVARHTDNLDKALRFYVDVLGFEILGDFKDHNGYDGVFIGKPNCDWHLEFTISEDKPRHTFDEDDILVFYPKTQEELDAIMNRIHENTIEILQAKNPYWNLNGIQIKDFDGHNVILSPLKIESSADSDLLSY